MNRLFAGGPQRTTFQPNWVPDEDDAFNDWEGDVDARDETPPPIEHVVEEKDSDEEDPLTTRILKPTRPTFPSAEPMPSPSQRLRSTRKRRTRLIALENRPPPHVKYPSPKKTISRVPVVKSRKPKFFDFGVEPKKHSPKKSPLSLVKFGSEPKNPKFLDYLRKEFDRVVETLDFRSPRKEDSSSPPSQPPTPPGRKKEALREWLLYRREKEFRTLYSRSGSASSRPRKRVSPSIVRDFAKNHPRFFQLPDILQMIAYLENVRVRSPTILDLLNFLRRVHSERKAESLPILSGGNLAIELSNFFVIRPPELGPPAVSLEEETAARREFLATHPLLPEEEEEFEKEWMQRGRSPTLRTSSSPIRRSRAVGSVDELFTNGLRTAETNRQAAEAIGQLLLFLDSKSVVGKATSFFRNQVQAGHFSLSSLTEANLAHLAPSVAIGLFSSIPGRRSHSVSLSSLFSRLTRKEGIRLMSGYLSTLPGGTTFSSLPYSPEPTALSIPAPQTACLNPRHDLPDDDLLLCAEERNGKLVFVCHSRSETLERMRKNLPSPSGKPYPLDFWRRMNDRYGPLPIPTGKPTLAELFGEDVDDE